MQQVHQGWNVQNVSSFCFTGNFQSFHTLDLGSPRASEMHEPMNHMQIPVERRRGEKKQRAERGDENQETTRRVDPMGVKLKIWKFDAC